MPRGFPKGLVPFDSHRDEKEISLFPPARSTCSSMCELDERRTKCTRWRYHAWVGGEGGVRAKSVRRYMCLSVYLSVYLSVRPSVRSVRSFVCLSVGLGDSVCTYCLCSSRVTYANVIPTRRCWAADSRPRTASPIWLRVVTTAAARPCVLRSPRATSEGRKIATLSSRRPGRRAAMLPGSASP